MKLPRLQDFQEFLQIRRISKMRGPVLLIGDLVLTVISALGAFALRLDIGPLFIVYLPQAYWFVAVALLIKPLVYFAFGFIAGFGRMPAPRN